MGKKTHKSISYLLGRRLQKENEKSAYLRFNFRSSSLPASNYREERERHITDSMSNQPATRVPHSLLWCLKKIQTDVQETWRFLNSHTLSSPSLLGCSSGSFPRRNSEVSQCLPTFLPQYLGSISGNGTLLSGIAAQGTQQPSGLNFPGGGGGGSYPVFLF